ncbi:MAG: peptidylprolyl isomerase [Thermonemataceae bacterium]
MKIFIKVIGLCFFITHFSMAQGGKQLSKKKDYVVTISTNYGDIELLLYRETPKHRANFINLVNDDFYNGLLFHRVIDDFMIQGGDPNSLTAKPEDFLGDGSCGEYIPAEFNKGLFHKKGVLAAARDNNPQKASSPCQFYIVEGKTFDEEALKTLAKQNNITYTEEQRNIYKTIGGTPHLDQSYTVFGEVIKGMDVVEKIAATETGENDRPVEDIKMEMSVEVLSKKKIEKLYDYTYEALDE